MEAESRVHLANPAAMQQYSGLKYTDDHSDARWLAHLLRLGVLPEGYIYPKAERGSCTRILRIIVSPRKLTKIPPLHHCVRGRYYDSSSCLLPAGDPGMSVALHHAALRLAQAIHRVTPQATRTCPRQVQAQTFP